MLNYELCVYSVAMPLSGVWLQTENQIVFREPEYLLRRCWLHLESKVVISAVWLSTEIEKSMLLKQPFVHQGVTAEWGQYSGRQFFSMY